jgi:probable addiction module antidote protein
MARTKKSPWDSAEYLRTDKDIAAYLDAVLEEAGDDPKSVAHALGVIARARHDAACPRYGRQA